MSSYEVSAKKQPDFEVNYRFYVESEGGRKSGSPLQHYRCDWAYESDDVSRSGVFMIYPEFLDANGEVIQDKVRVPISGRATMWILNPDLRREVHRVRIAEGTRGYFMEGGRRVAEAVVTKVLGLYTNET